MSLERSILIADDDRDLVQMLAMRCRALGLATETASDAITALQKIDELRPSVVLLDVSMPRGNGLSVREMMGADERLAAIPVIMLTGRSDEETIRRCHMSCAYYIAKSPDVWQRVEPLLRELLHLKDAAEDADAPKHVDSAKQFDTAENVDTAQKVDIPNAAAAEDMASSAAGDQESDELSPSRGEQPARPSLIDSVFAMLGNNESYLEGEEVPPMDETKSNKPWVLCIDDDADLSLAYKLHLEKHGIELLRAFAGMEGFRNAFMNKPQAIILDFELPEGNGDYVLGRLKDNPVTRDIPVLVLTGRRERFLERKMYGLGANEFLNKPCPFQILWEKLQKYIDVPVASDS